MTTEHHDDKTKGRVVSVEPATLINVKVVEIEKFIEVPNFVLVDVEKAVITEVPSTKYIKQEEPTVKYIKKEEPTTKYIKQEEPTVFYVKKEEPYTVKVPVPKEVPYDLPVVSMKKVSEAASEVTSVLKDAKSMLKEVEGLVGDLRETVAKIKDTLPEEIKMPNIIHEDVVVKDVKIIEEVIHVIGKVVSRDR